MALFDDVTGQIVGGLRRVQGAIDLPRVQDTVGNGIREAGGIFGDAFGAASKAFAQPLPTVQAPFRPLGNRASFGSIGGLGTVADVFGMKFGGGTTTGYQPTFRPIAPKAAPGATSNGLGDAGTAQWRPLIEDAAREYGIADPDIVQAIMMLESQGNARAGSSQGAMGLMQVMPFHFKPGEDPWDPRTNVRKGASILAENYKRYGDWDKAAAAYLGAIDANGNISTAQDANGTDGFKYVQLFRANLAKLKAAGATGGGLMGSLASIWGGAGNPSITQELGVVTRGIDQGIYAYGAQYGVSGHTGLDIGLADGTRLYSPVGGVVVTAGGTPYFRDESGRRDPATSGELKIRLDNGDEIVLGHTAQINVRVGQRVTAGQLVGLSGTANGDHLHLEYRQRTPGKTSSGFTIVDPRRFLR